MVWKRNLDALTKSGDNGERIRKKGSYAEYIGPVQEKEQWRIRYNHEIYQLLDLATTIILQRLKWAGHLQRMEESRVVKRMFNQKLEGKRPVGRPRARWDKIQGDARSMLGTPNWRKAAEDRGEQREDG